MITVIANLVDVTTAVIVHFICVTIRPRAIFRKYALNASTSLTLALASIYAYPAHTDNIASRP